MTNQQQRGYLRNILIKVKTAQTPHYFLIYFAVGELVLYFMATPQPFFPGIKAQHTSKPPTGVLKSMLELDCMFS